MTLRAGDKVKLTTEAKRLLATMNSAEHADEFGDCVGEVLGLCEGAGPELDVRWSPSRWQPNGLRYSYPEEWLELTSD